MNNFSVFLRRSLQTLWQSGYREEVYRCAVVAPLMLLAGFASALMFPQLSEPILRIFSEAVESAGITTSHAGSMAAILFFNNVSAAFSALLWGLVPYVYLAAFPLGFNFYLLGVMGAYYAQSGIGLGIFLVGLVPHGIFELPALVLFCAAGLYLCSCTTARLRGNTEIRLMQTFSDISSLFLLMILPLLGLAALVEAYITPQLLALVF